MKKLIFVLVDGLRCDTAFRHMGFMEHLLEMGAASRYRVRSELPSMSRPIYETLMTGMPVLEHGIFSNEVSRLSKEENLFGLARENGLTTAAAAYCWFSELYNRAPFNPVTDRLQLDADLPIQNGLFYFKDVTGAYPDSHLIADAEALRQRFNPDFLLVHPMNTDDAGHKSGSDSSDYVKSVIMIDYILSNTIPIWLGSGYTVLVTGDHGINPWGWHGGNGDDERLVPLYIMGPAAAGGDFSETEIPQRMLAPLCCDLLGIPRGKKMLQPALPGLKES
ncbi:Metalloenzyme superfamily protein [Sporobacter termitidis DSM 10068]|uniref:Metalloenzyme superfamily protein n=1 Tax=Sporobacter termitidis DSM 10068 TaxID=1123282 RepID=A0A1M5ZAT0_9FIRM|nr:alkaline phosphatase family protein [Sporobacter termitidis]SHI21334.1 Metalloenzyme superfamily protein [Sporobacter termitidis DSM 10068]